MGDHLRSMWRSNPAGVLLFFIDFQGGVVFEWRSNQEWRSITADTVCGITQMLLRILDSFLVG